MKWWKHSLYATSPNVERCCVDGDAGAPLRDELDRINEVYDRWSPTLPWRDGKNWQTGPLCWKPPRVWLGNTPTIGNSICVYGITDENGIAKCGIEQA